LNQENTDRVKRILRKSAVTVLICLLTSGLYAQRNYLGLSFGAALPGEEYAKKSLEEDGGYALPGFVIEFAGAYIFDYYFGIAATATFGNNSIDRDAFGQDVLDALPPAQLPGESVVDFRVGRWTFANIMAGPTFTIPAWKLNFDLRAVAGLSFLLSPPQEIYINIDNDEYFERRSNNTVNFAYMLGGGIRFNVNEYYAIRLSADYFRSKPTLTVDESSVIGTITGKKSYEMNVGTINLNIGIAYRF
jgi:hypothetical protein